MASSSPAAGSARVLVVEDDPGIAELLATALELGGYEAETVDQGEAAYALIVGGHVDLVLLDRMLPGLDGLEICRRVRAHPHGGYVPIILVTALASPSQREEGFGAGADDYIVKPFDVDDVLNRVNAWVQARRRLQSALADVQHESELLRAVHEAVACGIVVRGPTDEIVYANPAALALFGLAATAAPARIDQLLAQAIGENGLPLLPEELPGRVALRTGRPVRDAYLRVSRPDGEVCWLCADAVPVQEPDGRVRQVVVSFLDITARKGLEAEQAARHRLEGVLLAARTMEHELNNQLTMAVGYAELLAVDARLPDSARQIAEMALRGAQEASRLLAQLREISVIHERDWGPGLPSTIDLGRSRGAGTAAAEPTETG